MTTTTIKKLQPALDTDELFELTTGVIGHLTDLDQLNYLETFVAARIKQVSKPKTVAEFIQKARDAGHDALGIANDPEAIAILEQLRAAKDKPQ